MLVISREAHLRQTGSCSPQAWKSLAKMRKPKCCSLLRWSWFFRTCSNVHFPYEQAGICCLWSTQTLIFSASQVFPLQSHETCPHWQQVTGFHLWAKGSWQMGLNAKFGFGFSSGTEQFQMESKAGLFYWIFLFLFCYTCNWSWADSELSSLLARSLAEILWEATQIWGRIIFKPNQSWM